MTSMSGGAESTFLRQALLKASRSTRGLGAGTDRMRYTPSAPVHGIFIQSIISNPLDRNYQASSQ